MQELFIIGNHRISNSINMATFGNPDSVLRQSPSSGGIDHSEVVDFDVIQRETRP